MASSSSRKIIENVRYVNAEDSGSIVRLETIDDEFDVTYASETHAVFVQQGQYVIPIDGHAVVLHDNREDFEYIINNIVTDEELQDTDDTEQTTGQQIIYYAGEFAEQSQTLEDRGGITESTEAIDEESVVEESDLQDEITSSKHTKLAQSYADKYQIQNRNSCSVESNYVHVHEERIASDKILVADRSDHEQLQQSHYQYAILKNGKLHLQTLGFVDDTANSQVNALEDNEQHQQLQEQLAAFQQSINMDDTSVGISTVDLGKITGRNLITGQTVTLDSYFDKLQRRLSTVDATDQCFAYNAKRKRKHSFPSEQKDPHKEESADGSVNKNFINKRIVVGRTPSGKKIVGKIVHVNMTRGGGDSIKDEEGEKEISQKEIKQNNLCSPSITSSKGIVITSTAALTSSEDRNFESTTKVSKSIGNELLVTKRDGKMVEPPQLLQPHIIIKKHIVTRENFDYSIGKTLTGLMGLETVQRRLQNKNLVVKLVEKVYDHTIDAFNRTVSYVYGHMELIQLENESPENQQWAFVLHNENNSSTVTSAADDGRSTDEKTDYGGVTARVKNENITCTGRGADCLTENKEIHDGNDDDDEVSDGTDDIKDVSLEIEDSWTRYDETISLTIVISVDRNGKKSTRVNLSPQQLDSRCHVCGKEFKSSLQMRKHLNNVHLCEKSVKCESCSKNFANQTVLQRHQKIHTGERWYQCPKCSKSFNTAGSLKRHLTVHDPSLRPLECSVCVQRFTDESSLRKHLLIHTGIRAYACEVCNRAFVNQGDLNFHRRIHDPVKQFSCEVCGREFSRHSNLMRHTEIHRGVGALHRCDICGCSYSFVSSLTRHIVQKHIGQQQQQ